MYEYTHRFTLSASYNAFNDCAKLGPLVNERADPLAGGAVAWVLAKGERWNPERAYASFSSRLLGMLISSTGSTRLVVDSSS
jgi:hypothetical protein